MQANWPMTFRNMGQQQKNVGQQNSSQELLIFTYQFYEFPITFLRVHTIDKDNGKIHPRSGRNIYIFKFKSWITWDLFNISVWHENHSLAFSKNFVMIPNTPGFEQTVHHLRQVLVHLPPTLGPNFMFLWICGCSTHWKLRQLRFFSRISR